MIDTKALRSRVLDLAIRGKLTEQFESDGTAEELYRQIQEEKQKLIKEGKIKKEKPLPAIKDEEVPFEIPESWKWVHFGEIFQHNTGKALNSANTDGQLIEYITTSNVYWDRFELNSLKQMYFAENEIEKCTVTKGDLLICEGGDIGRSAIWNYDYDIRIQNHLHRLRAYLSDISAKYYYFIMLLYKEKDMISGRGIGLQGFSSKRVHSLVVPLPPLAEQKRIVEKVEEIFCILDTIDEAKEKYTADAESLKAKLITAGIQGKLTQQLESDGTAEELYQQIQAEKQKLIKEGKIKKEKPLPAISDEEIPFEIPGNWKWVRFGEISNIICTGLIRSGKEQYKDGEYYYFKMQNIGNFTGKCNFDDMVMINASQEEFEKTKLEEGDFLFNTRNSAELVGKAAVVHNMPMPKIILNNNILKIRFYGSIYPDFVNYVFISSEGRNLLYQFVSSTTNVAAIYQRQIVTLTVPLPPLAEQKRIADKLNELLETIN